MWNDIPVFPASTCFAIASARGLRHVFPEHTKRIFFKSTLPGPPPGDPAAPSAVAGGGATCDGTCDCTLSRAGYDTNNELTLQPIPTNYIGFPKAVFREAHLKFHPAAALASAALTLTASLAFAEPILKPHKYYGPIPQSALFLRVGMLGGAANEEMTAFLDGRLKPPFTARTDDFGHGLSVEGAYMFKPHPFFGLRMGATYSALRSDGSGTFVPRASGTTTNPPILDYTREFDVDLFVFEFSAVYYFSDASVKEFQTYLGAGFSVGLPHETFRETRVDQDTGLVYGDPIDLSEWDVAAGVHAVLGAIYYVTNQFGVSAEGRLQLVEGRFDQLETPNEVGVPERVSFVIDYTGFMATLGVVWAF